MADDVFRGTSEQIWIRLDIVAVATRQFDPAVSFAAFLLCVRDHCPIRAVRPISDDVVVISVAPSSHAHQFARRLRPTRPVTVAAFLMYFCRMSTF